MNLPTWTRKKELLYACVLVCMLLFGGFALWQNLETNLVFDEAGHIFGGYSFLKTGEYSGVGVRR